MKIAIGCDHGGFILKSAVIEKLHELGCEVVDFGTDSDVSVDYPIYGEKVANAVYGIIHRNVRVGGLSHIRRESCKRGRFGGMRFGSVALRYGYRYFDCREQSQRNTRRGSGQSFLRSGVQGTQ